MIKFVIGLIALIFVALAVYTYTDKKEKVVTKSAVTHNVVKEEVLESKVEKPIEVAKELRVSIPRNNKGEIDFSELENKEDYAPDEHKTSDDIIPNKEWDDIESRLDLSHEESASDTKNLFDDELENVDNLENVEPRQTGSEPLSKEEWKDIEKSIEIIDTKDIFSIENDDLVKLTESLEN